jgi:hypothetical protein
MRLIDADEISKKAAELSRVYCRMYRQTKDNVWASRSDAVDHVMEMIYEAPTIEAEPVKHGEWIGYPECLEYENAFCDDIVCSECHHVWNVIGNCTEEFKYCPNCGARMDGE